MIKQAVAKALDSHLEKFLEKVLVVRKAFVRGEIALDALCFILEEDIYLFREIRGILREAEAGAEIAGASYPAAEMVWAAESSTNHSCRVSESTQRGDL